MDRIVYLKDSLYHIFLLDYLVILFIGMCIGAGITLGVVMWL